MKIRVFYEDTDVGGVVYHSNYLNFCERARSQLFFDRGMSPHNGDEFFVIKHVDAEYVKSAVFGDIVDVTTKLIEKKSASVIMYQEVLRDGEVLFKGKFKLAYIKNFKPSRIPKHMLDVFQEEN